MNTPTQTPFFKYAASSILAGIIGSIVISRIGRRYLSSVPFNFFIALGLLYLLVAIVYVFIWLFRYKAGNINNQNVKAFWICSLRYFIALDMFTFGIGKIFHLQFRAPLGMLDNPFSSIDDQTLLWAFFGKHYSYTLIIAGLQITSAILLVFRKTRLVGTFLLLPVLLNIVLLNYYYKFGLVVSAYTILLTIAVIYLMLLDYDRLVNLFFRTTETSPVLNIQSWKKNAISYSVIYIPLLLIAINRFPLTYPEYTGKYLVKTVVINGRLIPAPASSRDSVLTTVFIDKDDNDFAMDYNDYRRRFIGTYTYQKANNQIKVIWRWPAAMHDTLVAQLLPAVTPARWVLSGRMGQNKIRVEMQQVR